MTDKEIEKKPDNVTSAQGEGTALDAGGMYLDKALKSCFFILKIIMVVLVVLFATSGIFRVQSDEQALVLRLGKIRGIGTEARVLNPGLNWAFPEPVDEIVIIPVKKVQTLPIESLWYYQSKEAKLGTKRDRVPRRLNPVRDGYCLTRNDNIEGLTGIDYNIVHAKWQLTYRIDFPERFFKNIYYKAPQPGEDFLDVVAESVNPLLESIAADAIVTTMVKFSIDEAIVSKSEIPGDVKKLLQEKLDLIDSGITVVAMQVAGKITWPRQVDDAFQASNKASQESQKLITEANGYAVKILNEAGGHDCEEILIAMQKPGLSDSRRQKLLAGLAGTAQEQLALARAYRTEVVESVKANADYLHELLPEYRKRPELVLQKIYQDAIEEVLGNADEKIFIQPAISGRPKELRVLINRDPSIRRSAPAEQDKQ